MMYREAKRSKYLHEHSLKLQPKGLFSQAEVDSIELLNGKPNSFVETILIGDHPVAVIGMVLLWPGVAEVWSVISEDARRAPISFHKCVLSSLVYHEKLLSVHRTQMGVRDGYEEAILWAEALGFKSEGLMLKYGPDGKDFWRYARVK